MPYSPRHIRHVETHVEAVPVGIFKSPTIAFSVDEQSDLLPRRYCLA